MRYVATIELYVHGETPHEAMKEALKLCKEVNDQHGCHADVHEFHQQPFATLTTKPYDAHTLKMEIMMSERDEEE